jgi:hypothetical protein
MLYKPPWHLPKYLRNQILSLKTLAERKARTYTKIAKQSIAKSSWCGLCSFYKYVHRYLGTSHQVKRSCSVHGAPSGPAVGFSPVSSFPKDGCIKAPRYLFYQARSLKISRGRSLEAPRNFGRCVRRSREPGSCLHFDLAQWPSETQSRGP